MAEIPICFWGFAPSGLEGANHVDWLDESRYTQHPTPSEDPTTDTPAQSLLRKWYENPIDSSVCTRDVLKIPDRGEIEMQKLRVFLDGILGPGSYDVNIFQDVLFLESSIGVSASDINYIAIILAHHSLQEQDNLPSQRKFAPHSFGSSQKKWQQYNDSADLLLDDLRPRNHSERRFLGPQHAVFDSKSQEESPRLNDDITGMCNPCFISRSSLTPLPRNNELCQNELVAVKKSKLSTGSQYFERIRKRFVNMNGLQHPNLAEIIAIFLSNDQNNPAEITCNMVSPLAPCDLKQLFHYRSGNGPTVSPIQLEALTSALAYLHNTLNYAHRSINSSNILVYQSPGSSELVLKLASFSLSADVDLLFRRNGLSTVQKAASQGVVSLSDREWRKSGMFPNDVLMLGCVFIELVAFIIEGRYGVLNFRKSITTSHSSISDDWIFDTHPNSRRRGVKPEVFDWMAKLSRKSQFANTAFLVIRKMLTPDEQVRITAHEACSEFLQSLDPRSLGPKHGFPRGDFVLRFASASQCDPPAWYDKLRIRLEKQLGAKVDWSPLPDVTYPCAQGEMMVTWKYGNKDMSQILPVTHATALMNDLRGFFTNGKSLLPTSETGTKEGSLGLKPYRQPGGGRSTSERTSRQEEPLVLDDRITKEIYLCVDKVLVEVRETTLCPILQVDTLPDDKALLVKMRNQIFDCNGWLKNIISWKTCTEISFVKFKIAKDKDVLPMDFTLPVEPHDYEYKDSDRPDYIKIYLETVVARNVLCGIHDTAAGAGETDLIDHILKKRNPPKLDTSADAYGLRAMQGLSLKKICWWTAVSYILGLSFVIFWLSFVDKLDLQNAFMPVTVLATMLVGALATTQVLV